MTHGDDDSAEEVRGDDLTALPPEEQPPAELGSESALPQEVDFDLAEPQEATRMEPALPDGDPFPEAPASPDAADSVDALLSAELLPEGLERFPEAAPELPENPTFQVQFRSLKEEARAPLRKVLEGLGVTVTDKAWAVPTPSISQLSEFQAVSLLQAARALGTLAEGSALLPSPLPSEEDLALGDLSLVPEPSPSDQESAASIVLPKGEREVLVSTPDRLPGCAVRETVGILMAHRSISRRLFREEELQEKLQRELRSVPGRSGAKEPLPSSQLQIALRELLLDLRKGALAKGANSVLGVKLEVFSESAGTDPELEQLRLVAIGTAAVVEKS